MLIRLTVIYAFAPLVVGLALLSGIAKAQETAVLQSADVEADPVFDMFWQRFREAVTLDDREIVRAMTRLPILLDGKEYDGDGFLERFDWLFTSAEKECFASEAPARDGDIYELFCGEMIFIFRGDGGNYRFTDIGAND